MDNNMIVTNLIQKGGAVMWPLLALALISFIIITDKITLALIKKFSKQKQNLPFTNGLRLLELIGQIAPVLGFLGTVTGIMAAFKGMSQETNVSLQAVSGGMYEALYTTALGLIISIVDYIAVQICKWSNKQDEDKSC